VRLQDAKLGFDAGESTHMQLELAIAVASSRISVILLIFRFLHYTMRPHHREAKHCKSRRRQTGRTNPDLICKASVATRKKQLMLRLLK